MPAMYQHNDSPDSMMKEGETLLIGGQVVDVVSPWGSVVGSNAKLIMAVSKDLGKSPSRTSRRTSTNQKAIRHQLCASLAVSLGSLVVGFASSYTSPALESMDREGSTLHPNKQEKSWIGSLLPLLALVGGLLGGPMIDRLGRRATILATAFPFFTAFLLIALAENVAMVMVGRALCGLGVGLASLALPVYLGETIEPKVRGVLGLLPTTLGNIGVLVSYTAGMFLDWSQLALLGAALPIPFLASMFFIPETPRWYVSKDKPKAAKRALRWLRGGSCDVSAEMAEIQDGHDRDAASSSTWSDLASSAYLKPISIALGLMFFQQMSGINAVIFYSVKIFSDAGSSIDSNLSSIVLGIVNVFSTLAATVLIDRAGRKKLLYVSSTSMMITLAVLGCFFNAKQTGSSLADHGWVPLVCLVVYIIGFSIGFGPIPWLMMGEILPARIRGPGASLTTAFNWTCSFIVTKTFSDLNQVLGSDGTFWLFSGFCTIGLAFIIFIVPETSGKSLEDIERQFISEKQAPAQP